MKNDAELTKQTRGFLVTYFLTTSIAVDSIRKHLETIERCGCFEEDLDQDHKAAIVKALELVREVDWKS